MNAELEKTGLPESVLTRLREVFAAWPAVEQALLFGSRAKGAARAGSDIDLALKGRALTSRDLNALAIRLDDLLLPYKTDLVLYSRIDTPALREHVDRVGIVLYVREDRPAQ